MQGIDISNYQRGIDLDKVPFDFMICKATEGTGIVHDTCDGFVQKAKALEKKWGFYHFLNGEDPVKQAESPRPRTTSATACQRSITRCTAWSTGPQVPRSSSTASTS